MSTGDMTDWIGRTQTRLDQASAAPLRGLAALFDRPGEAAIVPPLGHWLYFLPNAAQSQIGADGHARLNGELPDLGLPRRMWAGGRLQFLRDIAVGAAVEKTTTILDIVRKTGSTGPLAFIKLRHEIRADGELAVIEDQDLVYREPAIVGAPGAVPSTAERALEPSAIFEPVAFDPVKLFRFSALTFNGHRIHYDRDYAREVEGYAGLVVHGPYQAMLLLDLFARRYPDRPIRAFDFRSHAPLLDFETATLGLDLTDTGAQLSLRSGGRLCMSATIGI
jgi:3-methylfumaryl-CoA hydratase